MLSLSYKTRGTFPILIGDLFLSERVPVTTAKTISAIEGASDRRSTIDFGLTDRALRFAQFYAANPRWGVTVCATYAGYSDQGRAAHVRGCELLRDPRVIRAIVHFGGLAFVEAQALATRRLRLLADGDKSLSWRDHAMIENLTIDLDQLARRAGRLDKVYAGQTHQAVPWASALGTVG